VLPTLIFILWAYGMYALISALSRHRYCGIRAYRPLRRYAWLGLMVTAGVGLSLAVVLAQSFNIENQNLKPDRFLRTAWAEDWLDKVESRVEDPPIMRAACGGQPAYTLLHPGTHPAELAPENTVSKPKPAPKIRKPQGKCTKVAIQKPKKDQVPIKNKAITVKKKKTPPTLVAKECTAR
jgi:hypothetical protein